MTLEQEKVYALVGTNGCGKTTLFNIICSLLKAKSGNIFLAGTPIVQRKPHEINTLGIGRTFQDLRLAEELTVLENVLLSFKEQQGEKWWKALLPASAYKAEQNQLRERAKDLIDKTFLAEVINHKAGEISYGQQKLLTLACCVANDAKLLLLDEPVAGINPAYVDKMVELVKSIRQSGKTVLLIEHNAEFIEQVSDQVFFLDQGEVSVFDSYTELRNNQKVQEAYV